jgi:hypothetical protein
VIYAAKSSEDVHGSIPDQLASCREAIAAAPGRVVLAEYADEAYSAYRGNRGPNLAAAMEHAEELARISGGAELWVQHSDRLARGDGRSARHVVEIALWAMKNEIRVRSVYDPDTFRDLLYAVVTGQRNYEDSRRTSLGSRAGIRRAAARGSHRGICPDGYKVHSELDNDGNLHRRLVIDADRQPLIATIFKMYLDGHGPANIRDTISDAGWHTRPTRVPLPRPWSIDRITRLLGNPRYAGMSAVRGEVMAKGCWPAYITEGQHATIRARLHRGRRTRPAVVRQSFLLAGILVCGRCGAQMRTWTGRRRQNGSHTRRYACTSPRELCVTSPMEAAMVDQAFVKAIPMFIEHPAPQDSRRVRAEQLVVQRLLEWAVTDRSGPTAATLAEAHALNELVRRLFTSIVVTVNDWNVEIRARRASREERSATIDLVEYELQLQSNRGRSDLEVRWTRPGIVAALRLWATRHGGAPACDEWELAGPHPSSGTVQNHFGSWEAALAAAELERRRRIPRRHPPRYYWTTEQIMAALRTWTTQNGRAPKAREWRLASPDWPCYSTVRKQFGSWEHALARAGLYSG